VRGAASRPVVLRLRAFERREHDRLGAAHAGAIAGCVVVEAAEVEGSVDEVETELARGGEAPAAGDLDGSVDAHADLAGGTVSLVPEIEADHVRRRGIS
jgi:hypothetical protein